jgi:hypothetical protein
MPKPPILLTEVADAAGLDSRLGSKRCQPSSATAVNATGITAYLENGGTLEHARTIANHESPRTTKLYDRTREGLTAAEIGRIRI